VDITINLYADWWRLVIAEIEVLQSWGFQFDDFETWKKRELSSQELTSNDAAWRQKYEINLIYAYLDLEYRLIPAVPRAIKYAKNFRCPSQYRTAFQQIEGEIKTGVSLFPRLSRWIIKAEQQDGLLFDWGIHHLHLGLSPDPKHPGMVLGYDDVLFVKITDKTAYFLTFGNHKQWADVAILKIMHDSFPEFVKPFELKGIICPEPEMGKDERQKLRKAGSMTVTNLEGIPYISSGGGISTAGRSVSSTIKIQQVIHWYNEAETCIINHLLQIVMDSEDSRFKKLPNPVLVMERLEPDRISVVDRAIGLKVNLLYSGDQTGFSSIEVVYNPEEP